ncbi:MAG TPA: ABC transporter permease subunit [Burkholderiales bacterium]|nr:ABC transporter permease subunit [Burkholderiales bacterium]
MSDATDLYYAVRVRHIPEPHAVKRDSTALSDAVYCWVAWIGGSLGVLVPLAIVGYLAWHGLSAITPEFLFDPPRGSSLDGKGGIWPAITGSLALVGLALGISLSLGIGAGIYLAEFNRSPQVERISRFCIESLAAVPGLVYSMFGYAFLVVTLQLKISLLAGGLTLGFVMLPLILIGTHEALRTVGGGVREAAHALGVSHAYLFMRVVWPIAWPAICTAIVLSAVHALGAAAPLLYTAATVFTNGSLGLEKPVMALPTHLYFVTGEIGATPYAFGTALVLALLVLVVSALALLLRRRKEIST